MKKWKLTLLASASSVLLAGSVYAADLPLGGGPAAPIPYANWTGPYGGVQIGVASYQNTCAVGGVSNSGFTCGGEGDNTLIGRDTGMLGGVRAGYDFQDRYFVYGLVADWDWTSLKNKTFGSSGSISYESKVNWLASFRGRAGLALDANLIYVTGGLAIGNFTENVLQGKGGATSFTDTLPGWVGGVGFEHKFNRNWSVGLEYLHYDFAKNNHTYTASGDAYNHDFTHVVDAAKLNLNYRW